MAIKTGMIVLVPASALAQEREEPFLGTVGDECGECWEVYVQELKDTFGVDATALTPYEVGKMAQVTQEVTQDDVPEPPRSPVAVKRELPPTPVTPGEQLPQTTTTAAAAEDDFDFDEQDRKDFEALWVDVERRCEAEKGFERAWTDTTLEDANLSIRYRERRVFEARNRVLRKLGAKINEKGWYAPKNSNLAKFRLFRKAARTALPNLKDRECFERRCGAREHGAYMSPTHHWFVPGFILDTEPLRQQGFL